jgi:hypothetical protein
VGAKAKWLSYPTSLGCARWSLLEEELTTLCKGCNAGLVIPLVEAGVAGYLYHAVGSIIDSRAEGKAGTAERRRQRKRAI